MGNHRSRLSDNENNSETEEEGGTLQLARSLHNLGLFSADSQNPSLVDPLSNSEETMTTDVNQSTSQVVSEVEWLSGAKTTPSTHEVLRNREWGIRSKTVRISRLPQSISAGQMAAISNRRLPNRRKIVDQKRTKTFCCHYITDGLLTASQDQLIRLYRRGGNRQRYTLQRSLAAPIVGWSILDLIVSPDGRHAVYGTWNESVYQCKIYGDEPEWQEFCLHPDPVRFAVFSLRFCDDGEKFVAGTSDRRLYVYDRCVNRTLLSIVAHEDDVNAVCFGDASSNIVFSGADDGLCKVWDRRSLSEDHPQPVGVFAGHRDGLTFIDSRRDGRFLLTNSKDQSIKLWDLRRFSSIRAQEATKAAVARQRWDYRWQSAPTAAKRVRQLEGDSSVMTFRGHSVLHTLVRAHFSPDHTGQRFIYTGCARGCCVVYDILTGQVVQKMGGHAGVVRDCAWHPTDNEITTCSWDGSTCIWRFDQRAVGLEKNEIGEEDSCDENYNEIDSEARGRKKVNDKMDKVKKTVVVKRSWDDEEDDEDDQRDSQGRQYLVENW